MAGAVVDFCEYRVPLEWVYAGIKKQIVTAGVPVVRDEPDGVFYAVAEAFDNYREAYVRKEGVDEALGRLAVVVVMMMREGD